MCGKPKGHRWILKMHDQKRTIIPTKKPVSVLDAAQLSLVWMVAHTEDSR